MPMPTPEPTWGAQETKTFGDFERPNLTPIDPAKVGSIDTPIDSRPPIPSLLEKLRPLFAESFTRQAREEIDWEIGMMFYPNPQNNSLTPVVAIFAQTPGVVIGTTLGTSTMAQATMNMEENVDTWVRQTLETLREGLSKQLTAMQEMPRDQGLRPPANGGLIFPGN